MLSMRWICTLNNNNNNNRGRQARGIHLPPDTAAHRVPWTSLLRWDSPAGGAVASVGPWLVLVLPVAAAFHALPVEPYMDEIFQVPQAALLRWGQSYWNPMIATLPGLYLRPSRGQGSDGRPRRCRCKWCWCCTTGTPSGENHDGGCSPSAFGRNLPRRWLRPVALWLTPDRRKSRKATPPPGERHASPPPLLHFLVVVAAATCRPRHALCCPSIGTSSPSSSTRMSGPSLSCCGVARNSSAVCDCCQHLHCCC